MFPRWYGNDEKEVKLTEKDIRDLIDLTLIIGEREWFKELVERLNEIVR